MPRRSDTYQALLTTERYRAVLVALAVLWESTALGSERVIDWRAIEQMEGALRDYARELLHGFRYERGTHGWAR
ncbi:MAG TPA: hypothetical protein VGP44_11840 [Gemmatimonadales bacterium]|nr:hypothetical protein [Gemmatimonadales bacterium]